jgi:KDO2-lipid IV(A) lauroyltransferase
MLQRGCTTLNFPLDAVYQKLSNKKIDDFIFETRSRFGGLPIEMKQTFKEIVKRKNTTRGFCMVADQSPSEGKANYFVDFFGKETPFYTGMASIHEMTKYPLLFASMHKKNRGYYEISMEVISDSPAGVKEFAVVNKYAKLVEKQIRLQPECYLWTHKRWKFAK